MIWELQRHVLSPGALQVVVAMLDPLQEGGHVTAAAAAVLDQLVVKSRSLLKDKMKSLPPLPQGIDRLGNIHSSTHACKSSSKSL